MPRQDVPYPTGAICRLRERIGELFDLLGQKLHSINGVEGDGQGNVTITSGDPAIVINNDAAQHEIEIDLDSSQLPAAAVSSVNGATGAVVLNADDIPSDGSSDVQADIDALKLADTGLNTAIGNEATARANADSTLQTNINAVTAGIPTEISNQLAADTTIVRTSGNQNIADIKTVATQATGSYSQQIANSDKVKNELDNYTPMLRTTGNQTKSGQLTFSTAYKPIILLSSSLVAGINMKNTTDDVTVAPGSNIGYSQIVFADKNDVSTAYIRLTHKSTGGYILAVAVKKSDNTWQEVQLINSN